VPTLGFMTALTVTMRVMVLFFTRIDEPTPAIRRMIFLIKLASVVSLLATIAEAAHLAFLFKTR
jgi:hypothetical protein